ncbi:MAG: UdgX family uracil-DNA binding protein [Oligoflexus sp.]
MSANEYLPEDLSLPALSKAAKSCHGCELYRIGTQTVFGRGAPHATFMFVGEQPGDVEDSKGEPFVGPAGKLLRQGLEAVGYDMGDIYITNAVKHFYWTQQGNRRLHKKPKVSHIKACLPWLEKEILIINPRIIVALGTTAGRAVWGRDVTIHKDGGQFVQGPYCDKTILIRHPSSLLRISDRNAREEALHLYREELANIKDESFRMSHESVS